MGLRIGWNIRSGTVDIIIQKRRLKQKIMFENFDEFCAGVN